MPGTEQGEVLKDLPLATLWNPTSPAQKGAGSSSSSQGSNEAVGALLLTTDPPNLTTVS